MADIDTDYVVAPNSDNLNVGESPETVAEIKAWLCPTDSDSPASEYQKHINSYVPGTGEWILETDQYRRWSKADDQGALWIRGIPGSGKSVVAARFIQRLQAQEECPVLFFFFREIIISNRTPRSLCQDFACGLLPHSAQLQTSLKTLKGRHQSVDATPFEELRRCLSSALAATSRVFCVVDALDEMEPGHEDFIRSLIDLANSHPSSIKLVLTSRQMLYLEERFRGTTGLIDLRLDRGHVDQDIERYIEHRLSTHQPPIKPEEAASMKKSICERGRGLFLYARLMMDELLSHPEDIMSQLAQLPDGLGDMYTDILREHAERSGTTLSFQRLVLQWITHSARPLRLLELATAIDSLPDRGGLRPEQDAKVAVRTACGPLLELCEDGVIQIIHHSLTEFFRDPNVSYVRRTEGASGDTPVLEQTKAHAHIARTCISYLLDGDFDVNLPSDAWGHQCTIRLKEKMQQFPLLQYSTKYWPVHAAEADGSDEELLAIIDRLLRHSPVKFETWKAYYIASSDSLIASSSALHVAAFCGLRRYVERIVSDMDVDITDKMEETPLAYAAKAGHADIVTLLLQHGARHDAVNKDGMAPVHHAADRNRPHAIRALLEGGADPMLPKSKEDSYYGPVGRTALFYACRYGHLEVLEELRRKVNAEHLRNGPLHWAAGAAKPKVLSALLQDPEVRLAINNRDADGNTPLYLAAYAREPDTVKVLLEHGADANAVSEDKRKPSMFSTRWKSRVATRGKSTASRPSYSPLHGWAHLSHVHAPAVSIHNMQRVAEMLARAGGDVNGRNHEGRTALYAIEHLPHGEEGFGRAMVSVLLAHGADATVTDFEGNTPLHFLNTIPIDVGLVRALVNAGVDINAARKTDGRTFIMEHVDLFVYMDLKPFHELNVDFNRQDAEGNTAAHLAADSMPRFRVERWLDIANPEIRNHAGKTVLHKLVKRGPNELSVIQRMLDNGFSLESRDHRGHTVLLAFLADPWGKNFDNTVKVLLELGANAQATDYEGKSALHVVAGTELSYVDSGAVDVENKLKVMRLLIAAGVDVNSVDYNGNTILHDSVAWGTEWYYAQSSAWAALELGVEPGRQNHRGKTILHMAATIDMHRKSRQSEKRGANSLITFVLDPQRGLDVNAPDYEGITPLHLAASKSERNSWMLIQAGADIQSRTLKGETPLHFAARAGQANIVGLLLDLYQKQSLSVDSPSLSGRTALHEAARSGRPESVKLLLDAGADPHEFDRDGRGPLHAAAEFVETHGLLDNPSKCKCGSHCSTANCRRDVFGADKNALHFMGLIIQNENGTRNIREVVRLLLAAGADLAHLDNSEFTATDVALMSGSSAVVDELRAVMGDVYRDPPHEGSPLPADILGESLCSLISQNISAVVEAVQVPEDSHTFLERAMSTKNELLVEGLVKSKGLRLIREDGTTPLRLAARWGLTSMMKRLIPYAGNLEPCYATLMAEAAKRALPNLDMIKLLTQNRESQDCFRSSADEAMRTFAKGNHWWHPAALTYLLDSGADPNTKGAEGETPLHCALSAGESDSSLGELWPEQTLEVLLAYKADVNAVSSAGLAPISTAIKSRKSPAVLKMLLDHDADLSLGKEPAIYSAIDCSNIPATEILLQAGVDPNAMLESTAKKITSKKFNVQTILELAACPTWIGIVPTREKILSLLLEYGANPYLSLENGRSTPLHEISGRNGIVKPIIQAGYDLEQRDVNGKTPLIKACSLASDRRQRSLDEEHTAIDLIAGGADVHAKDDDGLTPLHYAAYCKLGRTVQTLLAHSASVTAKDNRGLTPLYYAFIPRKDIDESPNGDIDVDIINDLLDAGADPLERGPCGRTALHFIAPSLMQYSYTGCRPEKGKMFDDGEVRSGDIYGECAKLYRRFVEAGCDRNARDNKGNTPVFAYVATEKWYHEDVEKPYPPTREEMTAMFTDHDIFVANDAGDTLLHVVARRNDDDSYIQDAPAIFSALADLGLDPLAENKDGQSALDAAHAWDQEKILAMYARNDE